MELTKADSLSSSFMTRITLYRNDYQDEVFSKARAQLGYALAFVSSLVETATALVFTVLSLLALPVSRGPTSRCLKWLASSSFSIAWSFANLFLNPVCELLVADEKSAREIAKSGRLLGAPAGAVLTTTGKV